MNVDGPTTSPSIVGCQLTGGEDTLWWNGGALGRLEGCLISGAKASGVTLWQPTTSPLVTNNTFRDSRWGILLWDDVDAAWAPGEGNTFENLAVGPVDDTRVTQTAA